MDNFSQHPKTIGEIKSDKTSKAKDWTPRDVLISMLRDIDAGNLNVENLLICYENDSQILYSFAGDNKDHHNVGMLEIVKKLITER